MEQADDLLKNVYGYAQRKAAEEGRVGEASELHLPDEVHDEHAANTMFVQLRVPVGGQVDVVLTSLSAHGIDAKQPTPKLNKALAQAVHGLTGARLDALLATRLEAFRAKFDRVFRLADRTCTPASGKHAVACSGGGFSGDAIETGMVALSQVLGGMTYLDGTWFKATKPFYNNSVEQPAVVSFTASPCRDGFARGFLWDEGFHQLLVARWDAGLTRDVLLHWLALLQSDGWIPREQFIGGETRRRIESRWWTQYPTHANPPTLLLALEVLIDSGHAPEGFLACVQPKVRAWLHWFKRSQRAPALHSFKWSGRKRTEGIWHTLSSGLDDYPRANWTSDVADRHVDLYSWIYMMHRVVDKVHAALRQEAPPEVGKAMRALQSHVAAIHWSNASQAFADRGYLDLGPRSRGSYRVDFVPHYGYVSLFPLLLGVLPPGFPSSQLQALVEMMRSEKLLMSKAGLRSLSMTAPGGGRDAVYGTQEDYWRGKVWVNVNYLALAALYQHPDKEANALMGTTYSTLRANLVETITAGYVRKGFLFEQYDDKTRQGLKHKPFAGWTALVLLIMAELY